MKTIWLSLFLIVFTHQVCAYDFKENGIFYNVFSSGIDEETGEMNGFLEVTFDEEVQGVYPIVSYYAGDVVIPDSVCYQGDKYPVKRIGAFAFSSCPDLISVSLPQTITEIREGAFNGCENLTSIIIPRSVITLAEEIFIYCPHLEFISVEDGNPIYDSREGCNAVIETATNTLLIGSNNTFIPNTVTAIGHAAMDNKSFVELKIPDSVVEIGESSFFDCEKLQRIEIPNSVTSIGDGAFTWCPSLVSVISHIEEPTEILESCWFESDDIPDYWGNVTLYVPKGTRELYKSTKGWNVFLNIVEMDVEPTKILQLETESEGESIIFGLDGKRWSNPHKGLNIMKGKKFMVK